MPAVIAGLDMAAQDSRAAAGNRTQNTLLLAADVTESMAMSPDDFCQFQRRALDRLHQGVGAIGGCGCA
jgi:hypothetical protein